MSALAIIPAVTAHAALLAPRLRAGDRREVELAGITAEAALERALRQSIEAYAAVADGVVLALWGLGTTSAIGAGAWAWLMTADGVERYRLGLLRQARRWLGDKGRTWRFIDASADPRYEGAIKLLEWLGFADAGPDGNPGFVRYRRQ